MLNPKIGIIVHGPGIVDSGYAKKIINFLSKKGDVTCKLGGTMGRTAVIDAHLENVIDIKEKLLPSQSISLLSDNDILFLLNSGKSIITGHTFAYKVLNNVEKEVNLIQIERPDKKDGSVIQWSSFDDYGLIDQIADEFNLAVTSHSDVKDMVKNLTGFEYSDNTIKRKVAGVSPGENIMLNGIVIGKANSDSLTIIAEKNQIVDMIGGDLKQHGLEKLGLCDLSKAIIKTGYLRRMDDVIPRSIKHEYKDILRAAYLNHAAEDIYQYRNVDILISVGDDTTLLSSDILYRFNVPIIGITDGDLDKVVLKGFKLDESLIIQVQSGYDDIVGDLIYKKIFIDKNIIRIKDIEVFKEKILRIVNDSGIKYTIVDKQLS